MLHISDLDNAPCGFLTFTDAGIIVSVNETLVQFLCFKQKEDIEGKPIESLFTIATRIFYQTHFFPLIKLQGKANEIFLTLKTQTGELIPVICNVVRRITDPVVINHCIILPVAERGKYEQEILKAKKAAENALDENVELVQAKKDLETYSISLDKGIDQLGRMNDDVLQFSHAITHDLQEPIRKIAVWSDRMIERGEETLSQQQLQELKGIHRECLKLRSLSNNLERYISLNIKREDFTLLNLNDLIKTAYTDVVAASGLTKEVLTISDLPPVEGYQSQIEMLFSHLFENYLRFRDLETTLHLNIQHEIVQVNSFRSTKDKFRYINMLKIILSDNGGTASKSREYALLLNKKTDIRSIGIGFGISSARKIVDNHYGSITATINEDQITKIVISLPLLQH